MACFKDGVFALALTVMALVLCGCGSSSKGGGGGPPSGPPKPIDFVSQSVQGTISGMVNVNGSKSVKITPQPFSLYIDADKMNVRVEANGKVSDPKDKIDATLELKAIASVGDKKVTLFRNTTISGKHDLNCTYFIIAEMPDAKTIKAFIELALQQQPVSRAADGNKQMVISKDLSKDVKGKEVKGNVTATVELGDDNVLRQVDSDVKLAEPMEITEKGTMAATDHKAGAPDDSKFVVDKTWGKCTEGKIPNGTLPMDLFDGLSPSINLPLQMAFELFMTPEAKTQKKSDLPETMTEIAV